MEKRELARLVQEYRRSPPDYEDDDSSPTDGGLFWESSQPRKIGKQLQIYLLKNVESDYKSFASSSYQINGGPEHVKVSIRLEVINLSKISTPF